MNSIRRGIRFHCANRFFGFLVVATFLFLGCVGTAWAEVGRPPLKVGFLIDGPLSDWGWNHAHNEGRLYLESKLKGQVQTSFAENVPESAEAERVMEKMIAQGNKLMFLTSYGYLEPGLRVAHRHPDVIFMYCGRCNPKPVKNLGTYFANYYEAMYASGVVAGRMTKTNKIGYIAGHPIPEVLLAVNAVALGARSVNPKVTVKTIWVNSWNDPATEAEASKSLIEKGADVLVGETLTIVQVAERQHVSVIGCHADVRHLAPHAWLTGEKWDWGPLYARVTKSVLDGSWRAGDSRYGVKDGSVKLSSFGKSVPEAVQKEALGIMKNIADGKLVVFKGPMSDREGRQRIPAGVSADMNYLDKLDWLVAGVEGALPKK